MMKRLTRKLAAGMALMVAVPAVLAGCGGTDTEGGNSADGNGSGKVKLTFETSVYTEAPHKKAIDMLLQKYNEINPNVEITVHGTDYNNFFNKLTTEVVAGTQGDIVQLYPENLARYNALVEGGAFVNLDEYIKGTDLETKLVGQELNKLDGSYYAISSYAWGSTGIFYRKSLLEKAGVNPDDIRTLEDFKNAAAKLGADTNGDGKLDQYGFASVASSHTFTSSEWYRLVARPVSGGVYFPDGESGPYDPDRINVNSEANVWAAEWWQDLLKDSNATPAGTRDKKTTREMFWNGAAAMIMDGPWFIGMTRERDEKLMDDLGMIPQPVVEYNGQEYKPNPTMYPLVTMISKKSKHQKEAWEFLEWMTTPEAQEIIQLSGMIPSNKEYSGSEAYSKENPLAAKFLDYVEKDYGPAVMDPPIAEQGELAQIMQNAAEKMFVSQADAKETLDEAAAKMKEVMK
ncbi:sugar ABC transporter substrate-binding protein [Paenibacillus sp. J2TS4]|uniref:ABC transporter substrate-binding protein n=1 Tax=Paenibacillus sp. J2TS4 TaxID=2807194 RepID=UPI001B033BF8|nr:sugar ABC transporter substrate-binding protein [Paenibacillus sp. J2TS4]GIP32245.1 sugar ABC transporter substrate-binding protein [Paenibacillus sp. J2TS4]